MELTKKSKRIREILAEIKESAWTEIWPESEELKSVKKNREIIFTETNEDKILFSADKIHTKLRRFINATNYIDEKKPEQRNVKFVLKKVVYFLYQELKDLPI